MSATSYKTEEVHFKPLTQLHHTPVKLHTMYKSNSSLRWRECGSRPTHGHTVYGGPALTFIRFGRKWPKWSLWYKGKWLDLNHRHSYFIVTKESISQYRVSIIPRLFNASISLIPCYLGKRSITTISQGLGKVDDLRKMEELTCRNIGLIRRHFKSWTKWFEFKMTSLYYKLISDS